jgi:hypothetical protein
MFEFSPAGSYKWSRDATFASDVGVAASEVFVIVQPLDAMSEVVVHGWLVEEGRA